jgi:hypothetical protein
MVKTNVRNGVSANKERVKTNIRNAVSANNQTIIKIEKEVGKRNALQKKL